MPSDIADKLDPSVGHAVIDIETNTGGPSVAALSEGVSAPKNYKAANKIAAYKLEKAADIRDRSALDPMMGQVLCIGVAVDDAAPVVIYEETEFETLLVFARGMMRHPYRAIAGHNIISFDLPFLCKRAAYHAARCSVALDAEALRRLARMLWSPKRWGNRQPQIIDTMVTWQGADSRARASLDALCEHLNIERAPGQIKGADVPAAHRVGRRADIVEHCMDDVECTRRVLEQLIALGMVQT